jgi:hypothetical protein
MEDKRRNVTAKKVGGGKPPANVKPYLAATFKKNRAYRHQVPLWLVLPSKPYSPPRIGA